MLPAAKASRWARAKAEAAVAGVWVAGVDEVRVAGLAEGAAKVVAEDVGEEEEATAKLRGRPGVHAVQRQGVRIRT